MNPLTRPLIIGIGGTTRSGSSSERLLKFALSAAEAAGARAEIFAGPLLDLPMYAPDRNERAPAAKRMIAALRQSDGVILASPGYHGTVSGLIKNALDYTEDLSKDAAPYLQGKAVGCVACAGGWQAAVSTLASLRSIVHALRGWPTPLGVCVNSGQPVFRPDGELADPMLAGKLRTLAEEVVEFARMRGLRAARAAA